MRSSTRYTYDYLNRWLIRGVDSDDETGIATCRQKRGALSPREVGRR